MTASRTNILLIVLGAAVLLAAGYFFMRQSDDSSATALTGTASGGSSEDAFIQLSSQLDPITIDPKVFSDPRFTGLTDISTQIVPESSGRTDPFAPFGAQ